MQRTPVQFAGMSIWHQTHDTLTDLEQTPGLTVDQRIQIAQAWATLSVAQELSIIHHEGIAGYEPG